MKENWREIQEKIGYQFRDISLLKLALTHSSYANEIRTRQPENNERAEFLGDAVLELVCSDYLYREHPDLPEGELTRLRAGIVCESSLAYCARSIELGSYLLLGKGEEMTGGRDRDSITSDGMEAMIGAIYLDGGIASAKEFIHKFILEDLDEKKLFFDSKTILQEIVQGNDEGEVTYQLLKAEGPDHNKVFTAAVLVDGKEYGQGAGKSKKAAEQQAAYEAIKKLK